MAPKTLASNLICRCGSKDFETLAVTRNSIGRTEYRVACRACRNIVTVGKSTYALYRYVSTKQPSPSFLKLFDLG